MSHIARNPSKQSEDASPIIEDSKLPKMPADISAIPTTKGTLMPENPSPDRGKKGRMKPVSSLTSNINNTPQTTDLSGDEKTAGYEDQVVAKTRRMQKSKESYVRLEFHVENSQVTLLDVHEVEGPLKVPDELYGEIAYEVSLDSKRIGVGSLADVGIIRAYPRPDADQDHEGHHIIELPSFDFFARVPKKELLFSKLNKMKVSVLRIKVQPEKSLDSRPLEAQFGDNLREIARLEGVKVSELPVKLQSKLKKTAAR